MPTTATSNQASRQPLSISRVLDGATGLADRIGIEALTIRKLAAELEVKPMTIYHHVPSKDAIIGGIVDGVFGEIELPDADTDWKAALRHRCISMREVLSRHPWAAPLMESRTSPGSATLRHHDAVLGCLRGGGLSIEMTAHAYAVVDSFVYGFALQEASLPFDGGEEIGDLAASILESFPVDTYPHLGEFTAHHVLVPGYNFGNSFEFGLDLLLDGVAELAG